MNGPGDIELRREPDGLLQAWRGDRPVAVFVEQPTATGARLTLMARQGPIEPDVVVGLLDALTARATDVEVDATDPLVRDFMRHYGFTGALRGPLVPGSNGLPPTDDPAGVRDAVQQLLPGIDVRVEATPGVARSWFRRAVSGVSNLIDLYAAPDHDAPPTRFAIPMRGDLLVESVARCIDTTIAIRRRFERAASSVRRISFDHADFELLHGSHAGSADRNSGLIHMNASFASVEGLTAMDAVRAARAGGPLTTPAPPTPVLMQSPAIVPAPWNVVDGVTAHEVWHQMEGVVEARRYRDGLELRRRLGEALGVETLEQAVNGGRPRSPDHWKLAFARLVDEVSAYGATRPIEATAEMFMLWWCSDGERAPIVELFGELVVPVLDAFDT